MAVATRPTQFFDAKTFNEIDPIRNRDIFLRNLQFSFVSFLPSSLNFHPSTIEEIKLLQLIFSLEKNFLQTFFSLKDGIFVLVAILQIVTNWKSRKMFK